MELSLPKVSITSQHTISVSCSQPRLHIRLTYGAFLKYSCPDPTQTFGARISRGVVLGAKGIWEMRKKSSLWAALVVEI